MNDPVNVLDGHAPLLWLLGVVWYGVGDTVTTVYGLSRTTHSVAEAGPVASTVLDAYGVAGIVPLKLVVFALAGVAWWLAPRPQAIGVPLGLAVLGAVVTAWNVAVILAA